MAQCNAVQTNGVECTRHVVASTDIPDHLHFCAMHRGVYLRRAVASGPHVAGHCMNYGDHRWCGELTPDGNFCRLHRRNNAQRAARHDQQQRRIRIIRLAREELTAQHGHLPWRDVITPLFHQPDPLQINYEVGLQYYLLFVDREPYAFRLFWHWLAQGADGNQPDIAPPRHGLAALARDAQNVHTAPVSAQTNAGVDMLLAAAVPTDQQTEKRMMQAWLTTTNVGWNEMLRVAGDVNRWFLTKSCRADNDNLYRKLLRGLVATINRTDTEMRPELYKRLWEECQEATGMCCEGHITRLCNVMVGFDDAFRPPVALGEILQQKMATIAGLDVSVEMKQTHALAVMNELGIPDDQRAAWLDAF